MADRNFRPQRVLGMFKLSKDGGWEGAIRTLTIDRKIRLAPNDNRTHPNAPAFRVMSGWQAIGDAWEAHTHGDKPREYLFVEIDDPFCPLRLVLIPAKDGATARLVLNWSQEAPHAQPSAS